MLVHCNGCVKIHGGIWGTDCSMNRSYKFLRSTMWNWFSSIALPTRLSYCEVESKFEVCSSFLVLSS